MNDQDPITKLLHRWSEGDNQAENRLFEILEKELKRLCHLILKKDRSPVMTMQTTEVFNELYMRLNAQTKMSQWQDRRHFFGIAARLVRQLLIDTMRYKKAQKRDAFLVSTYIDETFRNEGWPGSMEDLGDALKDLEKIAPDRATLVDMRFFMGFNMEQVADSLGISSATAKRRWRTTKAWLWDYLKAQKQEADSPQVAPAAFVASETHASL